MSWFDTKNFANLATKALKEAQKKIDKVLDIEEEQDDDDAGLQNLTDAGDSDPKPVIEEQPSLLKDLGVQPSKGEDLSSTESVEGGNAMADKSVKDESQVKLVDDNSSKKALNDDVTYELQTVDSDSTQSFEEVQLQFFGSESNNEICAKTGKICKSPSTHTSNDEMETATSSDIEIISNPNGDGSSTASTTTRTSPLKVEKSSVETSGGVVTVDSVVSKSGHCREPSEISIISIDSPPSEDEVEKLLKRISELNSLVEARELRLLQSEQRNSELQDRILSLVNADSQSEEYTRRLSALEKKFQNCIRERDALRAEIKELQMQIPKNNLTDALAESQAMVTELRLEGEKLSKEILQQSNIIKKLRSKEKSVDAQLKSMHAQFASTNEEIERLKKTLSAKEDVERTQIEAVHRMTSENQRLENENGSLRSKLDDSEQKLNTLQCSFEAVKSELRSKQHPELSRSAFQAVEREKIQALTDNKELQKQLKDFAEKLRTSELAAMRREQHLREENRSLLERLEAAELRAETSTQEISQTTIPLMRHLESLQHTLNQRTSNWNKEEKALLEKLEAAQARLKTLEDVEENTKRRYDSLMTRCHGMDEKLAQAIMQEQNTKIAMQLELKQKETEYNRKYSEMNQELEEYKSKIKILENSQVMMQQCLEDAKLSASVECLQQEGDRSTNSVIEHNQSISDTHRHSPTASAGINSLEDGGSIDWQQEDDLDCISNSGRPTPGQGLAFHYLSNNTTNNYEYLQSMLKQRDGELAQVQWELARVQAERNVLQEELSQLSIEMENTKEKLQSLELMEVNYNDLQTRYDALCQLYGEKVERYEELQLDLKECKEAYKIQIQELLMKT